jgi:hypothetical protein
MDIAVLRRKYSVTRLLSTWTELNANKTTSRKDHCRKSLTKSNDLTRCGVKLLALTRGDHPVGKVGGNFLEWN